MNRRDPAKIKSSTYEDAYNVEVWDAYCTAIRDHFSAPSATGG